MSEEMRLPERKLHTPPGIAFYACDEVDAYILARQTELAEMTKERDRVMKLLLHSQSFIPAAQPKEKR